MDCRQFLTKIESLKAFYGDESVYLLFSFTVGIFLPHLSKHIYLTQELIMCTAWYINWPWNRLGCFAYVLYWTVPMQVKANWASFLLSEAMLLIPSPLCQPASLEPPHGSVFVTGGACRHTNPSLTPKLFFSTSIFCLPLLLHTHLISTRSLSSIPVSSRVIWGRIESW